MESRKPSRTAWAAAAHRGAHQVLEQGRIFADPLALRILGSEAENEVRTAESDTSRRRMRMFIAARTRFAEDHLAAAVEKGVRQLVVLGAGLDTFAYRSPFLDRLRIFEVDHPATQAWKRKLLQTSAISLPNWLTFAPIDFERETLAESLAAADFDPKLKTFFTWLGVVPYLTEQAVDATLTFIGGLEQGAHVVFDYSDPPEALSPETRAYHDERAQRVRALGEAWLSYFDGETIRLKLRTLGFSEIEDRGPRGIAGLYFPERAAILPETGGHIVHAAHGTLDG